MNTYYSRILKKLILKKYTVSIAESCTGGLLSSEFTKIPGISKIFISGIVCYSDKSKIEILNINKSKLKKFGAVSKEIANEMSLKLFNLTKSDICISTTGIAGPTGYSKKKPLGLVYISILTKNKSQIIRKQFNGSRIEIQKSVVSEVFKNIKKLI